MWVGDSGPQGRQGIACSHPTGGTLGTFDYVVAAVLIPLGSFLALTQATPANSTAGHGCPVW